MGSAKELTLILVLIIGAWSISAVAGSLPFWLLAASLIWIVIQLREYRKIQRWSERPLSLSLYTSPSPRDLSTSRMPSSA